MRKVSCAVIGAGPAGIASVVELYRSATVNAGPGFNANDVIAWVDPSFRVGDFGTVLKDVPGNTKVSAYQRDLRSMYQAINPKPENEAFAPSFEIDDCLGDYTCPLWIAAEPLQFITDKLRQKVYSIEDSVHDITTTTDGLLELSGPHGAVVIADEVILAVGAQPKTLELAAHLTQIDPNTLFTKHRLENYLSSEENDVKKVGVIGSSHSAALAVMHLLQAGIPVKQFTNKAYKFAETVIEEGVSRTKYDNTGLKGEVASFTKKLLQAKGIDQGIDFATDAEQREYETYAALWECHEGLNEQARNRELSDCTHAGVCIGYKARSSLRIDGTPLASFEYNPKTAELFSHSGEPKTHIHVTGAGHPEEKIFPEGKEFAVGVTKFTASAAKIVRSIGLFSARQSSQHASTSGCSPLTNPT